MRVGKMKAMNYESAKWRSRALEVDASDPEGIAARRRRRNIIIAVAVVAALILAYVLFGRGGGGDKTTVGVDVKGGAAEAAPAVSVVVPGRQTIARTISATGQLAARHDMPVGVPGEGGQIVRV